MDNGPTLPIIEAFRRFETEGDPEPLLALFAENSECGSPVVPGEFHGPEGAREFLLHDRARFKEIRSELRLVVSAGDNVVLEWTRTGETKDGDEVLYDGVTLLEHADGRITRMQVYQDARAVRRQSG
jgi:ketosteroid isomerase-like protein